MPYVAYQVAWSAAAAAGVLLVLLFVRPGARPATVVTSWAVMGLMSGTLLNGALTMEHAAEMSYPIPANVSIALLSVVSSLVSWLQVVAGTALLQLPNSATCARARTPFAAASAACAAVGLGLLSLMTPEYRRAETERRLAGALGAGGRLTSASGGYGSSGARVAGGGRHELVGAL